jgi:hypothetical protein
VLDCPNDGIHEQLELWWGQLKQSGKARRIDRTHHLEEANSMFGIFRKVLVDHVQSWFKDGVKNRADLRRQQRLKKGISKDFCHNGDRPTPRTPMIVAIKFKTSASRAGAALRW